MFVQCYVIDLVLSRFIKNTNINKCLNSKISIFVYLIDLKKAIDSFNLINNLTPGKNPAIEI